jgi:MFS family permease
MVGVADGAAVIWAAPTLSRSFSLAPGRVGAIMATVLLVSGVLGPILGGVLADICQRTGGPPRTMLVLSGLAILSVPAGFFAIAPSVAAASGLLVVFVTVGYAISVTATTLTTVVIPNELRAFCMAVLIAIGVLCGVGLAPVAVSVVSGAVGGPPMIGRALTIVSVATSLLGAATFAFGRRNLSRAGAV